MEGYATGRELGHGAFGVAFLATRKEDGCRCVIKRIKMREMSKRDAGAARREVSVMQEVQHPNIVGYYDSFVELESMHIVMEYADGGTLHDVVRGARRSGPLEEARILRYFSQILVAVRCLHQHRILHRDLKTANVFLTAAGAVKLGDFGLSRMLSSHSQFAKSTVGTAYQLSPELCKGKPYGTESDVWALGCILYELCARRHAFAGPSLPATVMKIMRGAYDKVVPGPSPPAYSAALVEVMERCLTISTADRWLLDDMMEHPLLVERVAALDTQAARNSTAAAVARDSNSSPTRAGDTGLPTPITSVERGGGWVVGASREGGWGNAADSLRRSIPENSITPTGLGNNNVFVSTQSYEAVLAGEGTAGVPGPAGELEPPETPANVRQAVAMRARRHGGLDGDGSGDARQQYELGRRSDHLKRGLELSRGEGGRGVGCGGTGGGGGGGGDTERVAGRVGTPQQTAIGVWGSVISQQSPMDDGNVDGDSPFPLPVVRDAMPREGSETSGSQLPQPQLQPQPQPQRYVSAVAAAGTEPTAADHGGGRNNDDNGSCRRRGKRPPKSLIVDEGMQSLQDESMPWVTSRSKPTSHPVGGVRRSLSSSDVGRPGDEGVAQASTASAGLPPQVSASTAARQSGGEMASTVTAQVRWLVESHAGMREEMAQLRQELEELQLSIKSGFFGLRQMVSTLRDTVVQQPQPSPNGNADAEESLPRAFSAGRPDEPRPFSAEQVPNRHKEAAAIRIQAHHRGNRARVRARLRDTETPASPLSCTRTRYSCLDDYGEEVRALRQQLRVLTYQADGPIAEEKLPGDRASTIAGWFKRLGNNEGGCQLDEGEFCQAARKAGKVTADQMPDHALRKLFRFIDTDANGVVSFDEMLTFLGTANGSETPSPEVAASLERGKQRRLEKHKAEISITSQ